jgi:hemoglobin
MSMMMDDISRVITSDPIRYEVGEFALQSGGGEEGVKRLVTAFYHYMDTIPEADPIRLLQKGSRGRYMDNLTNLFLVWIGGRDPNDNRISQKGTTVFSVAITQRQKNAWLCCLQKALDEQNYPELYKRFIMVQFSIYAEMCCQ